MAFEPLEKSITCEHGRCCDSDVRLSFGELDDLKTTLARVGKDLLLYVTRVGELIDNDIAGANALLDEVFDRARVTPGEKCVQALPLATHLAVKLVVTFWTDRRDRA